MIVRLGYDSLSVKQRCPNACVEDFVVTFNAAVILCDGEFRIECNIIGQTNSLLYLDNEKL